MNVQDQQYQIVADTNGTIVNANGQIYQLNAGAYRMISESNVALLTSNFPIQLIQLGTV
jgi:hypothetical protein